MTSFTDDPPESTHDERILASFYATRALEEPDDDPEAEVRFARAVQAVGLRTGARVLDVGSKGGGFAGIFRTTVSTSGSS